MRLRKFFTNRQSLICSIKWEWKSLEPTLTATLVHSMDNRISQVIKSGGNFILH